MSHEMTAEEKRRFLGPVYEALAQAERELDGVRLNQERQAVLLVDHFRGIERARAEAAGVCGPVPIADSR